MLVVDELKKNDLSLRLVAIALAAGLCILFVGLWWVQVVSSREYQSHRDKQAYRTVRLPAVRGKISDREGRVLAENQPRYDLSLFLDELRQPVYADYTNLLYWAGRQQSEKIAAQQKSLGRKLTKAELKTFALTRPQRDALLAMARERVAGARAAAIGEIVGVPVALDPKKFRDSYARYPYMPYPILPGLDAGQIARFQENYTNGLGADLAMESVRHYPNGTTAAHLLGYVTFSDEGQAGDRASYNYEIPDCKGRVGIEAGLDAELRGNAGEESVLINSHGYRQSGNIENAPEPGRNAVLTLDLDLQRAAEKSIAAHQGANARAAAVVIDVRNGDVLALVSSPAINPVYNENSNEYLNDEKLKPAINRATQENYAPGSIFKPIIGLAALEAGVDPNATIDNPGYIYVGKRHITDLARPGKYNFRRAIMDSSNTYFITNGLRAGIDRIIAMAEKFHFGQRMRLPTRQETRGNLPTLERVHHGWRDGDTANICIGQGEIAVSPLQMAVAYSAIANGGTIFWPRLVIRTEPQDLAAGGIVTNYLAGRVRDQLGVSANSLKILRDAMLAETEDPEGTGGLARVPGLHICGKTGTAEIMDAQNRKTGRTTWFASFAPHAQPRYAVVVMVEDGTFGGPTCGPIAHDIYEEIVRKENAPKENAVARK